MLSSRTFLMLNILCVTLPAIDIVLERNVYYSQCYSRSDFYIYSEIYFDKRESITALPHVGPSASYTVSYFKHYQIINLHYRLEFLSIGLSAAWTLSLLGSSGSWSTHKDNRQGGKDCWCLEEAMSLLNHLIMLLISSLLGT
ncbi:unnamed protein product [Musa textilis]